MTERIERMREWIASGGHRAVRSPLSPERFAALQAEITRDQLPLARRASRRLRLFLEEERVIVNDGERIVAQRTIPEFPDIYLPGEKEAIFAGHYMHEQGRVCNISSDFESVLKTGLPARRQTAEESLAAGRGDADFLLAAIECIDAVIAFADRYAEGLRASGQVEAGDALTRAVRGGADGFRNALQLFRILHFCLWASNVYHNTVGRFDQYMWPYLRADLETGRLDADAAQELLEEFFLTFNRDSDLYTGMQQGDNGQSMMLGGCDREGNPASNPLTDMCLAASLHLKMIDPKINLRVNRDTPLEVYERCTELTKQGLGFPQYANDDVVIPGLTALGYDLEDARNYTVAACWEFIIPAVGMDIPNIGAVSLAGVVKDTLTRRLESCESFDALLEEVKRAVKAAAVAQAEQVRNLIMEPAPWQSVLMDGCLETGRDISLGAKYNNYGFHGTGFANAVDQLAAVKAFVFDEKKVAPEALLTAMERDYAEDAELLHLLRAEAPKLGRDSSTEPLADWLIDVYSDALKGMKNERGGIFRAGTASAMYYLWHAKTLGATADGRLSTEQLPANFSPALNMTDSHPLSVVEAFARPGVDRTINGGPLTLELHNTVFRNQDGLTKTAQLVRTFVQLGGHQLQLNAVSRETLLDAQAHPEKHRGLIVRVWGWSGHFVQLDKGYQDQIIARTAYMQV